jgi:hypothetical protein
MLQNTHIPNRKVRNARSAAEDFLKLTAPDVSSVSFKKTAVAAVQKRQFALSNL